MGLDDKFKLNKIGDKVEPGGCLALYGVQSFNYLEGKYNAGCDANYL